MRLGLAAELDSTFANSNGRVTIHDTTHSSPDDPWMIDQMQRLDTAYAAAYTLSTESVNKRVRCQ